MAAALSLAAAQMDPIPVSVMAVEPSSALKLDFKTFLNHTNAVPRFLINFIQLIGNMMKQTLRIDRVHRQPSLVMIIHDAPTSRPITTRLIERLKQLGELPSVMTDDC